MDVEIILHQHDFGRVGKMRVGQIPEHVGIIDGGVAVGDLDMPPAFQRREHHEQIGDAIAFVFVIVARWLSRFGGNRRARLDDQLSRMMRESQVRFCERLGVKFPGPTRRVSRGSRVQTAMRNCTRDEGRSFEVGAAGVALRSHPSGYPPEYFVFG